MFKSVLKRILKKEKKLSRHSEIFFFPFGNSFWFIIIIMTGGNEKYDYTMSKTENSRNASADCTNDRF